LIAGGGNVVFGANRLESSEQKEMLAVAAGTNVENIENCLQKDGEVEVKYDPADLEKYLKEYNYDPKNLPLDPRFDKNGDNIRHIIHQSIKPPREHIVCM